MLTHARHAYPQTPLRYLCALFSVNRAWYRHRLSAPEVLARDVALRDVIEHIILNFPAMGTAVSRKNCTDASGR